MYIKSEEYDIRPAVVYETKVITYGYIRMAYSSLMKIFGKGVPTKQYTR